MRRRIWLSILTALFLSAAAASAAFAGQWCSDSYGWWYQADESHYYAGGIELIDGEYYGFGSNGYMLTGWQNTTAGEWYYFHESGAMARDQWVGDYYLGSDGVMATDTWIGEYYVDASGKWVPGKVKNAAFTPDWIYGEYQNKKSSDGYSENHYADIRINVDKTGSCKGFADFGLFDLAGNTKGLYDSFDPSGDQFFLSSGDGRHYILTSAVSYNQYSLDYDGYDTVTLSWKKNSSWFPSDGKLVMKKVFDYDLDSRGVDYSGGTSGYSGGVG